MIITATKNTTNQHKCYKVDWKNSSLSKKISIIWDRYLHPERQYVQLNKGNDIQQMNYKDFIDAQIDRLDLTTDVLNRKIQKLFEKEDDSSSTTDFQKQFVKSDSDCIRKVWKALPLHQKVTAFFLRWFSPNETYLGYAGSLLQEAINKQKEASSSSPIPSEDHPQSNDNQNPTT